jgi:hypothetical protein
LQGTGGVENVRGGEAKVEVAGDVGGARLGDRLGDGGDKGDDVVIRLFLNLLYALSGEVRLLGELFSLFRWDLAQRSAGAADGELDPEPGAKLRLLVQRAAISGSV